jgi:uncharacterized membrane protein
MIRASLVALILASPVGAEPAYYRVVGVAGDDSLNIRSAPGANSPDIGDLSHEARAIEVTGLNEDGTWARIAAGERDGWVSTRFLAPDTVPTIAPTSVPQGMLCVGTEPFWSLGLNGTMARYRHPSDGQMDLAFESALVAEGRLGTPAMLTYVTDRNDVIDATITGVTCSDGMSDRTYGWSVTLRLFAPGQNRFLEGCCSLPRE